MLFRFLTLNIATILLVCGCSIEEFQGSTVPNGSLYVVSTDSAGAEEIPGSAIIVDGIERAETTPAYIHGIEVGSHEIIVRLFGYWNDTTSVSVLGGDTVEVSAGLEAVPTGLNGWLIFDANIAGARLLVNGRTFRQSNNEPVLTPAVLEFPWGEYEISAHKEGFSTTSPILPRISVVAEETTSVEFALEAGETLIQPGNLPIDFTMENVYGDSIRLSDLTGYVVLLNFWYVLCQPCITEFPHIDHVFREKSADGFRVIAVNDRDPADSMIETAEGLELTFPLLRDIGGEFTRYRYRVSGFPTNVLIDRTGEIYKVSNAVTEEGLAEDVERLLSAGQ